MKKTILTSALALGLAMGAAPVVAQETYFPIIAKGFSHQFWQAVKAGAEEAATRNGVTITFEGPNTEAEIDRQTDILNAAIAKAPQGLGFAALDSQAQVPALQQAADAGIPIVAFDSGVESDLPLTTCSTDNIAAAAAAADALAKAIGEEGQIAAVIHDQTSATGIGRRDGFLNRIAEAYPNIEVVDVQYANDALKAADNVKAMLQANPDIKGIFASNEGSAIGLSVALRETGSDIVGVGFDSGRTQKDAIMDGTLLGAITQNPVGIGQCVVDSLVKATKGEELPEVIDTGFYWYDQSNMADPTIAAVLYD
ncbi:ABC transporter substrate-binding protein [Rubellimicrobium aerolatum]|uniref:ABC transporter substrate-binding protein n=1 Tax=Rubellimicrobium aerolatum TaxID=490979 RepID=A0ABW0SC86_9RHOB|nr:ABC transporter substrate-binding protein [Rubellimicrobium aerolatum]MBP1806209.1 ribose transport system substrate-binding protein [Rubellimicrobium aerolatum]